MIRVNKDWLIKKIENDNLPYWKVYDGKELIEQNQTESDSQKSAQELNYLLDDLEGNICRVVISNKSNSEKAKGGRDYLNFEYQVKLSGSKTESSGNMALLKEIFDLKMQIQINELKKEHEKALQALEGKGGSGLDKALEKLMPLIQAYGMRYLQPGVAGINDAAPTETQLEGPTPQERLAASIKILKKADADYIQVIESIALIAASNIAMYKQYKPIIIEAANG